MDDAEYGRLESELNELDTQYSKLLRTWLDASAGMDAIVEKRHELRMLREIERRDRGLKNLP